MWNISTFWRISDQNINQEPISICLAQKSLQIICIQSWSRSQSQSRPLDQYSWSRV
jgi:hypothetical protein